VGRVSSPRSQYQQQRDWVADVRERLEMFGVVLVLIVGEDRDRDRKDEKIRWRHNYFSVVMIY